jgi:hypothetical protein
VDRVSSAPDPAGFAGRWAIDRDLTDLDAGRTGSFTGWLTVTAERDGYTWSESGTLTWGEHRAPAERRLDLRPVDGAWWMRFADGRPFHPWRFGEELVHPCAADLYRGRFEFDPAGPAAFTTRWEVTGPAKGQLIVSRMTRPDHPGGQRALTGPAGARDRRSAPAGRARRARPAARRA